MSALVPPSLARHGAAHSRVHGSNAGSPRAYLDFDRFELGLVARWRVAREVSVLLHYSHVFLDERTVARSLHRPLTDPSLTAFDHPRPTGTYGGAADTLRASLTLHL